MNTIYIDTLVVGAGVAGMNCALHLPASQRVLLVCKGGPRESDSFLAQGGICVLHDKGDEQSYFEDTMRAGHYENDPGTVRCMIRHSRETIDELISYGVRFERDAGGGLVYTREGAHSRPRILFHADCTGKEISSHLLRAVRRCANVILLPYTTMVDLLFDEQKTQCLGAVLRDNKSGVLTAVRAGNTVLATGGVGGLFPHSTNFRILTGDGVGVALEHGVATEHLDYVQFHPTTLYTERRGRRFLISESVRGEGAQLLNAAGERFVDELLPRDVVTAAIRSEMRREGSKFVRLDLTTVAGGAQTLLHHFPGIVERCREEGYDVLSEPIPVVPAQHYFMGGVKSDLSGRTNVPHLYAVGETCCNGVHGRNRLASNSLLEALIFARRAAADIAKGRAAEGTACIPEQIYDRKTEDARHARVRKEVDREHEQGH